MITPESIITITPIIAILVLFFMIIVMAIAYYKIKQFLAVLVVFLFSLVIGMMSIQEITIPFSPYIQIFFMLIQGVFFLLSALKIYNQEWKSEV